MHRDLTLKVKAELHNVPVPSQVDRYKYLIVCIDYFSKWSEAKAIGDKDSITVAQFLYELISRHGCFDTQINDQGREFVNSVSDTWPIPESLSILDILRNTK